MCFAMAGADRIEISAPIGAWAIGKPTHQVLEYWRRRGAKINLFVLLLKPD